MQRLAVWQSVLIGAAATLLILAVGAAVNTDFRRLNLRTARSIRLWLFIDISRSTTIDEPDSDNG